MIELELLNRPDMRAWGGAFLDRYHYLRKLPDPRTSLEGYAIKLPWSERCGLITFGRPQAQRCRDWYGGLDDMRAGRCEVTRWQVLNLSRFVLHPDVQRGGLYYSRNLIPGFTDRSGDFRSTLASTSIKTAVDQIVLEYLLRRPPVYLDEPYEIVWLMSYCDTRRHRGVIYRAAGFDLYCQVDGIQTWRMPVRSLTADEHLAVQRASAINDRAIAFRTKRAQQQFLFGE